MKVVKRSGAHEAVSFDKIVTRIRRLAGDDLTHCDPIRVAKTVVAGVHDGVHTSVLDDIASDAAAALASHHPQYAHLAGRIAVSNNEKMTSRSFEAVHPFLSDEVRAFAETHRETIDDALSFESDMKLDIFGFKTLAKSYLLRDADRRIVERPSHMWMRVALGMHCGRIDKALQTYACFSQGYFTHATPTLFHCGTARPNLASCFLLPVEEDSIQGIFDTNSKCALISKSAGGIGFSVTNVRAQGSAIAGGAGRSSGLLPMLKCFEATARYVDQGNKRKGAFAAYLEPWHPDVRMFLDLKKNHGAEEMRARDLFYALWIPDLFMERVKQNASWSLFCPSACPDLVDSHSADFEARYVAYEAQGVAAHVVRAQELWFAILDSQIETGTPYMLYKDHCNAKSNHQHLGTIRCSNLCTEIVQYSSKDEIAVCNLASIALPKFVTTRAELPFDFDLLREITEIVTENLNRVIDVNAYSREEAERSNRRHRPVGIGVQGLADVFAMLGYAFDSPEARVLNREIFETIYFASLTASVRLAEADGPYESYPGSPLSQGILQFDYWPDAVLHESRWDWAGLRDDLRKHGARNSLLVAPMPTASTAQILGNTECFEPVTSNIYMRRVLAGEFMVCNKHLVKALEAENLWNDEMRLRLIAANGSVQHMTDVPPHIRATFKTAWELSMRSIIEMAADRAPFIDQSQSLNLFVAEPTHKKLSAMHFFAWEKGLKTGMYYLRTKPATEAVKVCLPVQVVANATQPQAAGDVCDACSA